MRLPLAIIITSLVLAGCAGSYDKLADANVCEAAMPAGRSVATQLFPFNNLNVPARSLLGGGKFDADDTATYACIDATNNKNNVPKVPNLHKIRLDHLSAAT